MRARPAAALRPLCRAYSDSGLTHVDAEGRARMVDVGGKAESARRAAAECALLLQPATLALLRADALRKGDARCVAELAGVLAAKRAATLLPLCHAVPLAHVAVRVLLPPAGAAPAAGLARVVLRCEAACTARTGVEMEALAGAAVAALALYDMCKGVDKRMRITDLRVTSKSGGRSGDVYE